MSRQANGTAALALGALGVVFGDIGTSPLYAFKACFNGLHAFAATPDNVMGVLSLIFWSLAVVIGIKYAGVLLAVDNQGEGGVFALFALLTGKKGAVGGRTLGVATMAVLIGAAMFYGDGIITPAISVLSALEGIKVAAPKSGHVVVPATLAILVCLFMVQRHGVDRIGKVFGPVMLLWFVSIACLGVHGIIKNPVVLEALSPHYAVGFFLKNGLAGTWVVGAVVLCVTGGEALYADLGHFGAGPIRLSWYGLVFPALLLNYFGQGAMVLGSARLAADPFYSLAPSFLVYPLVGLATVATIIASQAIISGAFSLTAQAMHLGFCPRMHLRHTSAEAQGRVYVPEVNWMMMILCIALVLGFKSSDNLAGAYGIAITGTMVVTTILYYLFLRRVAGWRMATAGALAGLMIVFDLFFFGSSLLKLDGGGWFPLAVAALVILVMLTWRKGRRLVAARLEPNMLTAEELYARLKEKPPLRVPGIGLYLTLHPQRIPAVLMHKMELEGVLHEHVLLLTLLFEDVPRVEEDKRLVVKVMEQGLSRIIARYGFMETPNLSQLMLRLDAIGLVHDPGHTVCYLGRENLVLTRTKDMARWRKSLFAFLLRNAMSPGMYFSIPAHRVVEIGMHLKI